MAKKQTKIILGIVLILASVVIFYLKIVYSAPSNNFIIQGNSVYIDDNLVFINVTPHTSNNPVIEFRSKVYTGAIDIVVGFNSSDAIPKKAEYNPHLANVTKSYVCNDAGTFFNYTLSPNHFWCWKNSTTQNNETNQSVNTINLLFDHDFTSGNLTAKTAYWQEVETVWDDVSGAFNSLSQDFQGFDKWYYKTGFPVTANQTYKLRLTLQPQKIDSGNLKYFFGAKPSGETLQQAITNGHFYFIDPWTEGLNDGLLSYYKVDEGSGTIAVDSMNRYNITLFNTPTWITGKLSNGLNFSRSASEWGQSANVTQLKGTQNWTVNLWVNLASLDGATPGTVFKVGTNGASPPEEASCHILTEQDTNFGWWFLNCPNTFDQADIRSSTSIGNWLMMTMVYDGSGGQVTMYSNTTQVAQVSINVSKGIIAGNFSVGKTVWGTYMDGAVDEIGVWNRTLTSTEISTLYNSGTGITYYSSTPQISYNSNTETNGTYLSRSWALVNVSATDEGLDAVRLNWNEVNETFDSSGGSNYWENKSSLSDGWYNFSAWANNSLGNRNFTDQRVIVIDTTFPQISYGSNVQANASNFSESWVFVNVSLTESNFQNLTFNLYYQNSTLINSTILNDSARSLNFTGLVDAVYLFNVTALDKALNSNSTTTRQITLDNVAPNVSVSEPTGTKTSLSNINFSITASESVGYGSCIAWVTRGASIEVANTTLTCNSTMTGTVTVSSEANYVFHAWLNDSAGNSNYTNSSFTVSLPAGDSGSPSGGGGGTPIAEIIQFLEQNNTKTYLCQPFKTAFFQAYEQTKSESNVLKKIGILHSKFWDYVLCGSAGSIIPL